ncbi:hypothetical protein [Natronobacterium texcoconense]|uniref:Uncharacterized protein n=1 Tax=Natronobacterium texcoconense TaxID=1095778 RepID=A0A1H1EFG7_NATTX|nr:hypothetical protein [Natronobacterium texcoconense]SDQ87179.1 hypothetical protein SAMN04489842_1556 [Natronobacterium texcoconense]
MSDDRSKQSSGADDAESGELVAGGIETGGGPQRVVSEESVDDILDSLDDSTSDSSLTTTPDTTANEPDDFVDPTGEEDENDNVDDSSGDSETEPELESEPAPSSQVETPDPDSERIDDTEPESSQDATIDPDELAARIERGDVTGADVRAAEAGEGRESTPDIDDVDLSLDDLEVGTSDSTTGGSDAAGPLAGSIDAGTDEDDDSSATDREESESGLIGRLKRLFSS